MKTIDKLLLKSYSGPMVLTFFIVIFIFVLQFLWLYVDEIAGKGLEWTVIAELLFWTALASIPTALPLSTLLASIMTMGNLGENNELLALKSAGISLQRIMRPLMILVIAISMLAFYISNNLLPLSNLKMTTLLRDVRQKNPSFALDVGVFTTNMPGYAIKIGDKDPETNLLKEVMIYNHTSTGNNSVTIADSGYINLTNGGNYLITIYNGNSYEDMRNRDGSVSSSRPFAHQEFEKREFLVEAEEWSRTDEEQNKGAMQMLSIVVLTHSIDSLKTIQKAEASRAVDYYIFSPSFNHGMELDTANLTMAQYVKTIDVDSLFAAFDDMQRYNVVTGAIRKAEDAKVQVEYMKMEREAKRREIAQGEVEWHMKFTLSVACIIFFFIGAPLGAIIRKGGLGMPMVVSLFLFIIYWVMFSTGRKMAIQGSWSAGFAMWLPTFVLLPLGIFLTYKATTDSSLFNADKYLLFFKKIFGRMKKRIRRINLDEVVSVERPIAHELEVEIVELNSLCRQYDSEYSLYKNFIWSRNKWSMADGQNMLNEIIHKYDKLISQLAAIDDNEHIRELLHQYPALDAKKYKLSKAYINIGIAFLIAVFPIGIIMYILVLNKRKKLRYILSEIVKINDAVNVSLSKNE